MNKVQIMDVFKYLDKDGDELLTYNEFCEISEEKRRNIDPFESIV
jgi:Ca2+-binding EF-hand superfamily protein